MVYDKLTSAIFNDIVSGLRGYHNNPSISIELLADEVVSMRLQIIKEYQLKGILPINDLLQSINCINIDCLNIERCPCSNYGTPTMHFQIPLLLMDFGANSIVYIGSVDRQTPFKFYTSILSWNTYHKYRRRGKDKPFVYVDIVPNKDGLLDCFVFNAPLLKMISVVAIFKDPRQIEMFGCCDAAEPLSSPSWLDSEIHKRLVELKIRWYKQMAPPILPNDQKYSKP